MTNKKTSSTRLKKVALAVCLLAAGTGTITSLSSFTGDGESGGGNCWKTEQQMCNGTTTTTTNGVTTQTTVTGGKITGQVTGGVASNANVGQTAGVVITYNPQTSSWTTTNPGTTTVTVTSWRADCASGGNTGCLPTDCDKKGMDYKPCNS
ncbi:hypothetical protein [Paraflavitalea pollutisoli]|uniref:hypothetical protein n=1 Tax=Paraflavitalea pollutisoli TaxID=3034143 RepID=UPI0023ED7801|nr:hypothetical protein [Paraflavitalea sp. H1-2-19X]